MGFKTIYWTPVSGSYFLKGCNLEKCGIVWKNGRFSGRIWPDWGNTARADMAGLGSLGLKKGHFCCKYLLSLDNSAIKENNLDMILSLLVMDLTVL